MKRFIITLAIACAAISAGAQVKFQGQAAPQRVEVGTVRLGLLKLEYGNRFWIIGHTSYGELFQMPIGIDRIRAQWTLMDIESLFDMEKGQSRSFDIEYMRFDAFKAGKNRIYIQRRSQHGHIVLTRRNCEELMEMVSAFKYPDR